MRMATWLEQRSTRFWFAVLAAIGALIYLPFLGSYPLWDPWEPHYLQVAWEMREHHTWLDPVYRNEFNWWSKPILLLWLTRLGIIPWDSVNHFGDHELWARLPFALVAIAGGLLQFDWVRRLYGRTAGFVAGLALITAPQYLMIGRQVMIDVTFVMAYGASMGYLAVGLFTPRPELAPADAPRSTRWRAWLAREGPFVAFWALEAVALLAKGFVAQTLVVLVVAGYAIATFRWQDYAETWKAVRTGDYLLKRTAVASVIIAAASAACALLPVTLGKDQRHLYQALLLGPALLAVILGPFRAFPFFQHVANLLVRIRAIWGLGLFLAIGAPWYAYMTVKHGWPYWNEFIFYHHLGRAAGTIDKPGNTFDYFIRQLGYAAFPWSAFALPSLWLFIRRARATGTTEEVRNFFLVIGILLPFLFFELSGTKFAHYIFPVLPFFMAAIAVGLCWLREQTELDMVLVVALALVTFGLISYDLVADFRHIPRLFIYYWNRATPLEYQPFIEFQVFFFPLGIIIGALLLARRVSHAHVALYGFFAVAFAAYCAWFMMPALGATYTYKPLLEAYGTIAQPGEPIGQFNDWQQPERSVLFLSQNQVQHLNTDKRALQFIQRPGRKFALVDNAKLPALRRVAARDGKKLYVVDKNHPYAVLVSDVPRPEDVELLRSSVLAEPPNDLTAINSDFAGKLKLLGMRASNLRPKRGDSVTFDVFYLVEQPVEGDWQIFVHADGPHGNSHRIVADHYPLTGIYPTSEWKPGQIIHDTFTLQVPRNYPYSAITVWTGWYNGAERMPITLGTSDGDNRSRLAVLTLDKQ